MNKGEYDFIIGNLRNIWMFPFGFFLLIAGAIKLTHNNPEANK